MASQWGEWRRSDPWLLEVIEMAEQEARERGQSTVRPERIAGATLILIGRHRTATGAV